MTKQIWGQCDQCPTYYDVGPRGFRKAGDVCGDLSLKPEEGWPHNGCKGRVWPVLAPMVKAEMEAE